MLDVKKGICRKWLESYIVSLSVHTKCYLIYLVYLNHSHHQQHYHSNWHHKSWYESHAHLFLAMTECLNGLAWTVDIAPAQQQIRMLAGRQIHDTCVWMLCSSSFSQLHKIDTWLYICMCCELEISIIMLWIYEFQSATMCICKFNIFQHVFKVKSLHPNTPKRPSNHK